MKQKRRNCRFIRSFAMTLVICGCLSLLCGGIWVADRNTRAVGFMDEPAVVWVQMTEHGAKGQAFGYSFSADFTAIAETAKQLWPLIPPQIRGIWEGLKIILNQ